MNSEEKNRAQIHFNLFDVDGNGHIEAWEVIDVLRSIGEDPNEDVVDALIVEMDEDGNGTLEFEEFCEIFCKLRTNQKVESKEDIDDEDSEEDDEEDDETKQNRASKRGLSDDDDSDEEDEDEDSSDEEQKRHKRKKRNKNKGSIGNHGIMAIFSGLD